MVEELKNYLSMEARVLLTYPSTGKIMIIMGNWIDLVAVNKSNSKIPGNQLKAPEF